MSDEETKLMQQFGISVTQKNLYTYKNHKYDQLKDALKYARIEAERQPESDAAPS